MHDETLAVEVSDMAADDTGKVVKSGWDASKPKPKESSDS